MDTISINLNRELATKARPALDQYGIDMETALNVYLMQVISDVKRLSTQSEKAEYVRPPMQFDCLKGILDIDTEDVRPAFQFGCLKGILDIDDDFSDVLEDFKEYM